MPNSSQACSLGWRPFVYGGVASVVAEICTFPVDSSKTRLQLQGELVCKKIIKFKSGPYRGMFDCLFRVCMNESIFSIYRGLSAAVFRQITYGTIKFGLYHHMKRLFCNNPMEEGVLGNLFCAMFSGAVANAITNPTDVIKVRLQAYCLYKDEYPTIKRFITQTIRQEGLLAFYKGVLPTAIRAAVVCGVELPTYDLLKKYLIISEFMEDSTGCHFISSFLAGLCGALISNPIDITRTRLMNQQSVGINTKSYTSALGCFYQIVKHEGILALWKGFIPNWLRLGPWNILFFITFEQLRKLPF